MKTCVVKCVALLSRDQVPLLTGAVPGASTGTQAGSLRKAGPCLWPWCCDHRARWLPANLSLAAFHNDQLLLRRGPGKHDLRVVLENVIQLLGGHVLQVASVYHAGLGISRSGWGKSHPPLHPRDARTLQDSPRPEGVFPVT